MGLMDKAKEFANEAEKEVKKKKRKKLDEMQSSYIEGLEAKPDESIQAYEYKIFEVGSEARFGLSKTSDQPEMELNMLGMKGWDLVEHINMENGATQALIFKRPIDANRKEEMEEKLLDDYLGE